MGVGQLTPLTKGDRTMLELIQDYTILCSYCGCLLRDVDGADIEEIHTASDGADVCETCCDVCVREEIDGMDLEDAFDYLLVGL
jgi:hypothetical protein